MDVIGGYFGLELLNGKHFHEKAIKFNSARNCFEYILRAKQYTKVYIPYFTCEVMLEPIKKLHIDYEFYHIDKQLKPTKAYKLNAAEAFLYINYWGLKQNDVEQLAKIYGKQLIVDNAQAFYAEPLLGIDTFYSARKFFGVPDGAYLYTDIIDGHFEYDKSYERMAHLLKRIDCSPEEGFEDFHINEDKLINNPIKKMSKLTDAILCSIDYDQVKLKRIENFIFLDSYLSKTNRLGIHLNDYFCPIVYPYLVANGKEIKKRLIDNKIYVATYWPNVLEWCEDVDFDFQLAQNVVSLPIDQRYSIEEMKNIINLIIKD